MTILTINLDIPDDKLARVKAAVRTDRGMAQDPTNAQLVNALETLCKTELRAIVYRVERQAAEAAMTTLTL